MMSLNEDVDKVMRALSELSGNAKRLGSDSIYYAANRAWHELHNEQRRAAFLAQEKA